MTNAISLNKILTAVEVVNDFDDVAVSGICADSRAIKPQQLFIALRGATYNAIDYIEDAINKGAAAVVIDSVESVKINTVAPIIAVKNLAENLYKIANNFYQTANLNLDIIGITGTNGKTSSCHYIAQALSSMQKKVAVLGTIGNGVYGEELTKSSLTTLGVIEINSNISQFAKAEVQYVAMEVSSHALVQKRTAGLQFKYAIFTNLSRDHIDYHHSMEDYAAAKSKLFTEYQYETAIINIDDDYGRKIFNNLPENVNKVAISLHANNIKSDKIIIANNINCGVNGITADINTSWGDFSIKLNLLGKFNLYNALNALAVLLMEKIAVNDAIKAIENLSAVTGRMQCFKVDNMPLTVIDYAHTPQALEQSLLALKQHNPRKIWCVFGCGGDRDKGKRPQMAAIAEQIADNIIVTADNPRSESQDNIAADIFAGFKNPNNFVKENDRISAIKAAINNAVAEDAILIAGKGHEDYQIIKNEIINLSDAAIVKEALGIY